jgi:hypothetical protein
MMRVYAERHMLPWRRLQLQTAVAAMSASDRRLPFSAYDVDAPPAPLIEDTADEVGSMFAAVTGGNVVKLKGYKKVH